MPDTVDTRDAVHTETALPGNIRYLTRRGLLALLTAGLLTACGSSSSSAPVAPLLTTLPAPRIREPVAPVSLTTATRLMQLALLEPGAGKIRGLAWAPDGKTLAVGASARAGSAAQLWDVSAGRPVAPLPGPPGQVYQMAWSPDGRLLAAGVDDNTVRVWDMQTRSLVQTFQGTGLIVFGVAWSAHGERLAASNSDGSVQIWERATWRSQAIWNSPSATGQFTGGRYRTAAYTVAWSPDGRLLAATRYDGYVRLWDGRSGKLLHLLSTSNQPNAVSWSPDGRLLASASDDGTVQLWETASMSNIRTLNAEPAGGWAFAIPWSPDGHLLASTREDGLAQIWDVQTGEQVKVLDGQHASVWTAAWSPDNLHIATGSDDGTVCLWGVG